MLTEQLAERRLPALQSREAMLDVLQREIYGIMPAPPDAVSFAVEPNVIPKFCAGKAPCHRVTATCRIADKTFSFPFHAVIPTDGKQHPFFVHLNFRPDVPDRYMPTEELIDNGFAVLSFCYKDVTSDDGDFTDGLAGVLLDGGQRAPTDPGKITLWAWAAQRVMDWAQTQRDVLDVSCGIVCGHSRLGKTALWTGATDPRFAFAYSNDSGCAGAALSRGKHGETVRDICERFPFWFCERYRQYADREDKMPFDQHYLIASVAPRYALIGSASEDDWADPISEQLACVAASGAFVHGLDCPNEAAQTGDAFLTGDVGYHIRKGLHYFSREDWHRLIRFVRLHRADV